VILFQLLFVDPLHDLAHSMKELQTGDQTVIVVSDTFGDFVHL